MRLCTELHLAASLLRRDVRLAVTTSGRHHCGAEWVVGPRTINDHLMYYVVGPGTLTTSVQEASFETRESWRVSFGLTNYAVASMQGDTNISLSVAPDGSYAVSVSWDGRQQASTNFAADGNVLASSRLFYDDAGRQVAAQDAFGVLSSNVYNEAGQVTSTILQAPGMDPRTTAFLFDVMGRTAATIQPDGGVVTNQYYLTGELEKTWGSRTYPVAYTYDSQGRMATMQTYTNFAGASGVATTTWSYHAQRGYLTGKTYQDGKGPTYTYTPAGRLATRAWARGVVTTYQYGNAGDLAFVSYSDGTPTVANTFDRLGRTVRVQDGSGERVMAYSTAGQQLSEVHTNDIFAGLGVQRQYDAFLRLSGINASTPSGTGVSPVQYSYGADWRVSQVVFGSNTVTYGYITNRGLVSSITFNNGLSNVLLTVKQYDGVGQMTNIYSTVGGQLVSGHAYGYNLAGQRTNCVLNDGSFWDYGYDALGQVTNGTRRLAGGQEVAGQKFAYSFDDIGNRTWTDRDGDRQDYIANLLNEYTSRTVPGSVWIQGQASASAGVRVNGVNADRQGALFAKKLTVDNSAQALYSSIEISGIGTNGATVVTNTVIGHAFTPQTPEALAYDLDGNLTNDARWAYTWDGENRLIGMESHASLTNLGVPRIALAFTYDSQWRRVRKQVFAICSTNATLWSLTSDYWFGYNDWNLIHEEHRPDALTRRVDMDYVWGLDLNGSMQGAGGIGGLLGELPSKSSPGVPPVISFACFDANGNLSDLVSATGGSTVAHYEYSPFGETLVATGPAARDTPFRFSTKFTDDETGLVYYGHRYLSPQVGRWVSRDPIDAERHVDVRTSAAQQLATTPHAEEYQFNRNEPLYSVDLLGLTPLAEDFWQSYPDYGQYKDPALIWKLIGGSLGALELATAKKTGKTPDTCAARVSYTLNMLPGNHVTSPKDYHNDVDNTHPGTDGNYVVNAALMSKYLAKNWGKATVCSDTEAYYFASAATSIDSLRSEIMAVFAKCNSNCKNTYTAVVVYQFASSQYSGHVGVVRVDYKDPSTPIIGGTSAEVWVLPPTTWQAVKNP